MGDWRAIERRQGCLAIEDHGLVGDGRGSALVGRDGAVGFVCVTRFDSSPVFCPLLDHRNGGRLSLAPEEVRESCQHYLDGTGVLVTQLKTDSGIVEVTDAFVLHPGARLEEDAASGTGALVRRARVTHGHVDLRVCIRPRGGGRVRRADDYWQVYCPVQRLQAGWGPPPARGEEYPRGGAGGGGLVVRGRRLTPKPWAMRSGPTCNPGRRRGPSIPRRTARRRP